MDRQELMDRAQIEISPEDYDKIEEVYLASPDFEIVQDVVDYINTHKGYQGLIERYNDAQRIRRLNIDLNLARNSSQNFERQLLTAQAELEKKQRTIEYLCSFLTVENILGDFSKEKLAEIVATGAVE